MKRALTILLTSFALITLGMAIQKTRHQPAAPAATIGVQDAALTGHRIIVTYFTSNVRCESCRRIEQWTRQTVESDFSAEIARGEVIFRVLSIDEPAGRAFVQPYQIAFKTVIVSDRLDGKETAFTNLDRVWELVFDEADFHRYIRDGIRRYLPTAAKEGK